MKLTPLDIQQQRFRKSLRGYDARDVQTFLELVAEQVGELTRDMHDVRTELRRTQTELENHQGRESTLKEAMLTAQRSIDEIRDQADKEAQLRITEAELRAEKILFNAHKRVSSVLDEIQELKRQRTRAKEELRGVLNTHQQLLEVYEDDTQDASENYEGSLAVLDRLRAPSPPALPLSSEKSPAADADRGRFSRMGG